jgi:hypothetical protein
VIPEWWNGRNQVEEKQEEDSSLASVNHYIEWLKN